MGFFGHVYNIKREGCNIKIVDVGVLPKWELFGSEENWCRPPEHMLLARAKVNRILWK